MAHLSAEEISAITKQVKSRAGERFILEAHSFVSGSFYTYQCIWIILILLAESSKNLMISLSSRNKIILSKLEGVVCESYGLLFA